MDSNVKNLLQSNSSKDCESCGKKLTADSVMINLQNGEPHIFCCYDCLVDHVESRRLGVTSIKKQRVDILHKIESERKSKVLTLVHQVEHEEKIHSQYITTEDAEDILHELRNTPDETPVDLLLHCPGGLVFPAEQIALAIKERKGPTSVIIPHYAMSGATLIAIAAKEILMDKHAILGPLDPQIQGLPSPSVLKIKELKKSDYIRDEMLVAIDVASKSLNQMKGFIRSLLADKFSPEHSKKVAEFLTGGYMTHDRPITAKDASAIGFSVRVGIPDEFYQLLRLYRLSTNTYESMYSRHCQCL